MLGHITCVANGPLADISHQFSDPFSQIVLHIIDGSLYIFRKLFHEFIEIVLHLPKILPESTVNIRCLIDQVTGLLHRFCSYKIPCSDYGG